MGVNSPTRREGSRIPIRGSLETFSAPFPSRIVENSPEKKSGHGFPDDSTLNFSGARFSLSLSLSKVLHEAATPLFVQGHDVGGLISLHKSSGGKHAVADAA